jgi:putative DNA methylase
MAWDYAELVPAFAPVLTGTLESMFGQILDVLAHLTSIPPANPQPASPTVTHGTATALPWPENFFDAVLTDPPYYDNVPYGDYQTSSTVWLKRVVGDLYPDSSPRRSRQSQEEMVAISYQWRDRRGCKGERFEQMLTQAFRKSTAYSSPTASPSSSSPTRPPKPGKR